MIFLNSAGSAATLVFYLPGVCTHTDTKGKQRTARVRNILTIFGKNTICNEHPVYVDVMYVVHSYPTFQYFKPKEIIFFHLVLVIDLFDRSMFTELPVA